MIDERDAKLRTRFDAVRDDDAHPGGWDDVTRRVATHERNVRPRAIHRSWWRRRSAMLGGVASVAAVAGAVAVLFVAGLPHNTSPSAAGEVRSLRYDFDGPVSVPPDPSRPRAGVTPHGTTEVDFARQILRSVVTGIPTASGIRTSEGVTTRDWTYLKVPEDRRARSGGRPWVRYPTNASNANASARLFDPAIFTDPLNTPAGIGLLPDGVTPRRVGTEIVDGVTTTRYTGSDADGTYDLWLDERGWLVRSTVRFGRSTDGVTTARFVFNEPLSIREPSRDETFDVATETEANTIAGEGDAVPSP